MVRPRHNAVQRQRNQYAQHHGKHMEHEILFLYDRFLLRVDLHRLSLVVVVAALASIGDAGAELGSSFSASVTGLSSGMFRCIIAR